MGIFKNIVVQYTVITFIVTLVITFTLARTVSEHVTENLIQTHIRVFPDIVRGNLSHHDEAFSWFQRKPDGTLPHSVEDFFAGLLEINGVFRIKVWNAEGTILWSDLPELIGRNYADNELFRQAASGAVAYSRKAAPKQENVSEQGTAIILEIYTPVFADARLIGVVELYESDKALEQELALARWTVWSRTLGSGALLYLLLLIFFLQGHNRYRKTTRQLIETQDVTIHALAYQAEIHDIETGNHLDRTTRYVQLLADELSKNERDRKSLTKTFLKDLVKSAPLHDIGKVGVPDYILHKPGALTEEEFAAMKKHCEYGTSILRRAEAKLSFASFLQVAVEITQYHHEKWDGSGYPTGLQGEDIPLAARIMAVADVYDALRSKRYYKNPIPHEECLAIIADDRGRAFDPVVVDALLAREDVFLNISRSLAD